MRLSLTRYRIRNLLLAGGLALLGAILVFLYVTSYRSDVQSGADLTTVYVASKDIPEGTDGATVAGSYLKKESVLKRNAIKGAIASSDRITNLATTQKILEGEQVTTRQFHPVAQEGVLANISGNERAVSVTNDSNALLAGVVNDGDYVDVVANIPYSIRTGNSTTGDLRRVASRIILRDLLVLQSPTSDASGGFAGGGAKGASITLALTDRESEKLMFADKNGTWWLVLRPVARPADSLENVETIESILEGGLGQRAINQLTSGNGAGSISSGN